jgi:leucyl-tRNA synthetase
MLSDTPPERDREWTEAGIEGAWRFIQRVWRILNDALPNLPVHGQSVPELFGPWAEALRRATHAAIAGVTDDIEQFRFNRAVAKIFIFVNTLESALPLPSPAGPGDGFALREALESLVILVGPMMPHLAEEAHQLLGGTGLLALAPWALADPALLKVDSVTVAVQVNGKRRAELALARDLPEDAVRDAVLALDLVQKALEGKTPRKVIVVPNRIVNVVV